MKRQKQSSQRASRMGPRMDRRMNRYVPLIREFAARDGLFHEAAAKAIGMHSTDEKVLRLLGADALTAGDLVSHTGLTGAAVTALVDRLVRLGYVTRERDLSDRRKVVIRAVHARLRDINQLYGGLRGALQALLAKYDTAEFETIMDFLTNATAAMAEQTEILAGKTKAQKAEAA
jgi:DNA-binding MarR family transcriptional regulator